MSNIKDKLTKLGYVYDNFENVYEKRFSSTIEGSIELNNSWASHFIKIYVKDNEIIDYEISDVDETNNVFKNVEELEQQYKNFKYLFEILEQDLKEINL